MKKQNIIIIGIVAFALALAVGYALFSQTLTITGTATATGNFDVEFVPMGSGKPVDIVAQNDFTNVDEANFSIISTDKNTLTLNVNKLDAPGGYVTVRGKVHNNGSIDAKLLNPLVADITKPEDAATDTSSEFEVTWVEGTDLLKQNDVVPAGQSKEFEINIKWREYANQTVTDASAAFKIMLDWQQITVND